MSECASRLRLAGLGRAAVLVVGCAVSGTIVSASTGSGENDGIAFPGAVGYGKSATGWRGGEIVQVTTLADNGPGSLRACADRPNPEPRVCVFAVSGTIDLQSPIFVRSNTYLAGQTAPGMGVQLRIVGGANGPLIVKNAQDVVIRHLKVRPGASVAPSANVDAITVENAERVYLGNLSMAFATDETFNIHVSNATVSDITLADSILSLSLDRANHPKGRHSKGALICSDEGPVNACGRISLLRNLFAHHRDRMPDIKATEIGPVEVINNVFYNPISQMGEFYDLLGDADIAYVGNVALSGPSTVSATPEAVQVFEWSDEAVIRLYAADNIARTATGCTPRAMAVLDPAAEAVRIDVFPHDLTITPMAAAAVQAMVLSKAGDRIARSRPVDALDARVLTDVAACTGQVIDRVDQVGGWPTWRERILPRTTIDSDGDGLPDLWEAFRPELDPNRADDPWARMPGSAWSHLETWLATRAGDPL